MKAKAKSMGVIIGLALMFCGCATVPQNHERSDVLLEKEAEAKSTETDPGILTALHGLWPAGASWSTK